MIRKVNQQSLSFFREVASFFNDYYVKPYCRIGAYIVGIMTGYIMYSTDCKSRMGRVSLGPYCSKSMTALAKKMLNFQAYCMQNRCHFLLKKMLGAFAVQKLLTFCHKKY